MNYIKFFKDIDKNSVALAGGKGASLGEMSNSNFPIPDGFVVLSTAFEKFITDSKIDKEITKILSQVNTENNNSVEKASKDIQKTILDSSLSKDLEQEILNSFKELNTEFVAVRSSATAEDSASDAWAGQLDSFLNVKEKELLLTVKKCFASLFTERAIVYRIEKGLLDKHISVAVVIQKMVNSEKSGIAFSVHPVTNDYSQMIIEAGYGLGEAIVSGQITPDSYIVSKTHKILDKVQGSQEKALYRTLENQSGNIWKETTEEQKKKLVLADKEIQELSRILLNIEKHYGFPVDIEWAIEESKIYIVQSRPITTLKK
jgi:pyruvate, water dikinase